MNEIGGYFELELRHGQQYHNSALKLNTGRNAFEYILLAKKYKKVYLPYYTCESMLEPIEKYNLTYKFYNIDKYFEPIFDFNTMSANECFVYTNYFGLCSNSVIKIAKKCNNLIIDNTQAFYDHPLQDIDTFYSPRKYFGVSDGAYLYTDTIINISLNFDISYKRFEHLIGKIDIGAESFYETFKANNRLLKGQMIKKMSVLTENLMSSIDYKSAAQRRQKNFEFLHKTFKNTNILKFTPNKKAVPMVYPLLIKDGHEMKCQLIKNKIFVATYWQNVEKWCKKKCFEVELQKNLIPLPIDQRYSFSHMEKIRETITSVL